MHRNRLPHLPELDGLRGLAALVVFVHHFFQFNGAAAAPQLWLNALIQISAFGALGVDIFFVLSGFLITSLLLLQRGEPSMLHNFYWKRILRIWPVLLVHLFLFAVFVEHPLKYIVLSLLFVQNFSARLAPGVAGPSWTLSIEEQFYLLWPQVVRRFTVGRICAIGFGCAAVSFLLRILVPLVHHGAFAQEYTCYRLDGLGLGAMLACQWFSPAHIGPRMSKLIRALQSRAALSVFAAAAVALACFSERLGMVGVGLRTSVVCFATYRAIAAVALGQPARALRWLAWRPLVGLGMVSYALYMYHGFVLVAMVRHFGSGVGLRPSVVMARLALALGVSLLVSWLSLVALERPVMRLRSKVLRLDLPAQV